MIVLNQSLAQARLWLAANPPARVEKVDQSTGRAYTTIAPREWIRQGGAALAEKCLVLRVRGSQLADGSRGPVLVQTFRLSHTHNPDVDEWTRVQAVDTDVPLALAVSWAETRGLAAAIKGLLWDTASDDVPDPSERPRKPVEETRTQARIQEDARRNGNGNGAASLPDRSERGALSVERAHRPPIGRPPIETIPAPVGGPTLIIDEKNGGEWVTAGERPHWMRDKPTPTALKPADASMAEILGLAPGDGLPATSIEGTVSAARIGPEGFEAMKAIGAMPSEQPDEPATSPGSTGAGTDPAQSVSANHTRAENVRPTPGADVQSDGGETSAPVARPTNTDGAAALLSPAASSTLPASEGSSPPLLAGSGSLSDALRARRLLMWSNAAGGFDLYAPDDEAGNARVLLRGVTEDDVREWLTEGAHDDGSESDHEEDPQSEAKLGAALTSHWPEGSSLEPDDSPPATLADIDETSALAQPSPEQVALVGTAARRLAEAMTDDPSDPCPTPESAVRGVERVLLAVDPALAAPLVAGPADLRGMRRAKSMAKAASREWSRVVVARGGGTCVALCGVALKKGDQAEESGGKRRHAKCPPKVSA